MGEKKELFLEPARDYNHNRQRFLETKVLLLICSIFPELYSIQITFKLKCRNTK